MTTFPEAQSRSVRATSSSGSIGDWASALLTYALSLLTGVVFGATIVEIVRFVLGL